MLQCRMCGKQINRMDTLTIFRVHDEMLDFCSKDCLTIYMKGGK
jgi:endogenous inhibitor of DNA gyrase (YacG/DUF329 family)